MSEQNLLVYYLVLKDSKVKVEVLEYSEGYFPGKYDKNHIAQGFAETISILFEDQKQQIGSNLHEFGITSDLEKEALDPNIARR